MSAHTPGPWVFQDLDNPFIRVEGARPNYPIARVYADTSNNRRALPEILANAALIAAAPELLAALRVMVAASWGDVPLDARQVMREQLGADSPVVQAEAAIQKAEG